MGDGEAKLLARPAPAPKAKKMLAQYCAIRSLAVKWAQPGADTPSLSMCGADDGSLSLWRLEAMECINRFARHIGFVWAIYVDWSKDRAITGGFDGVLKLWDLGSRESLR